MRKFYFFFIGVFLCTGFACAAGRVQNTTPQKASTAVSTTRQVANSKNSVVSRSANNRKQSQSQQVQNNPQTKKTVSRSTTNKTVSARSSIPARKTATRSNITSRRISRAATSDIALSFNDDYNSCRDAYFTCMDQFCANQNETYRRCVCSSRLNEIRNKEKLLSQTADSLQDFQNLNIDVISKTASEVKSMLSASEGEQAIKQDISNSTKTLSDISDILKTNKKKSLSTSGTVDIAGDIKNIWTTTNIIGGSDIANLTGEALYNAVHTQCATAVSENCASSDLAMIASTYGMYIENDCSVLATSIDNRVTAANAAIRATRHQMQDARLDNYNAHNNLSVNDCVARVRQDITANGACGTDYIYCLDFSGKYLNSTTGEPIYSSDFYQLENQLSLSDDTLKNKKNTKFVNMLNKKRIFAEQSLDLCTDNADEVWDEFLRQAIVEIYQQQQQRVRDVKSECLEVVNKCYLEKSDMLKQFSDNSAQISLGHTLELSEDLCAEKLTTCSNLYGGGPEGLSVMVNTLREITDETIAQTCPELLATFAQNICAVSVNDSAHSYPYGCRVYAPGETMYAHNAICNYTLVNPFSRSDILPDLPTPPNTYYVCTNASKRYTSCKFNHYLYHGNLTEDSAIIETICDNVLPNSSDITHLAYYNETKSYCRKDAIECRICPPGFTCSGGTSAPQNSNSELYASCGVYYIGSLYQQLVRYAIQNCTRPSDNSYILSESLLADVDMVMRSIRATLVAELSAECENFNGTWVDIPWIDENSDGYHDTTGDALSQDFYIRTGTNKLWGYCK